MADLAMPRRRGLIGVGDGRESRPFRSGNARGATVRREGQSANHPSRRHDEGMQPSDGQASAVRFWHCGLAPKCPTVMVSNGGV